MPEPNSATTASRQPRPAPNHISAWPRVLAPLSMCSGSGVWARSRRPSGTASQPKVGPCTTASAPGSGPAPCSTMPGTPRPTPSTLRAGTPAASRTCARPAAISRTTRPGSGASSNGRSAAASSVSARSNRVTRTWVSPTSMPTRWARPGATRSRIRGRLPSDSTEPHSSISPSASRSPVTLVIDPALSRVAHPSSCRLSGPWKYRWRSRVERLARRRSRTVCWARGVMGVVSSSGANLRVRAARRAPVRRWPERGSGCGPRAGRGAGRTGDRTATGPGSGVRSRGPAAVHCPQGCGQRLRRRVSGPGGP